MLLVTHREPKPGESAKCSYLVSPVHMGVLHSPLVSPTLKKKNQVGGPSNSAVYNGTVKIGNCE